MKTINLFLLSALAFFFCASLHAQVTIGGLEEPKAGAILDLNSTAKGGLLLSNVNIVDLDFIPDGDPTVFPGVDPDSLDTNWGLRGALAYNTNAATGVGIYVWTGKYWIPATENEPIDEQIAFTVRTSDGTYIIPTSGNLDGNFDHTYDWNISVDGGTAVPYIGTGGDGAGITLSDLTSGDHQIRITPREDAAPGWGNAFGHYSSTTDANAQTNKDKLISINAPLTTLAFSCKTTDPTVASSLFNMFAYLFYGCTSLTEPAVLKDTYIFPRTVTNFGNFFYATYYGCTSLKKPQDFTPLSGWYHPESQIKAMSNVLAWTHMLCTSLEYPIDVTPFSGWIKAGHTNINNMQGMFHSTYDGCTSLEDPSDFTPLSGWFPSSHIMSMFSTNFYRTHYGNTKLKLTGQTVFPDWLKTMRNSTGNFVYSSGQNLYMMFELQSPQGGDTGEPKFQNGTVLSSAGTPSSPMRVYRNRTDIVPVNYNWKADF
jgi:hypothetical protein